MDLAELGEEHVELDVDVVEFSCCYPQGVHGERFAGEMSVGTDPVVDPVDAQAGLVVEIVIVDGEVDVALIDEFAHRWQTARRLPQRHDGREADDAVVGERTCSRPAQHCVVEACLGVAPDDIDRVGDSCGFGIGDIDLAGSGDDARQRVELQDRATTHRQLACAESLSAARGCVARSRAAGGDGPLSRVRPRRAGRDVGARCETVGLAGQPTGGLVEKCVGFELVDEGERVRELVVCKQVEQVEQVVGAEVEWCCRQKQQDVGPVGEELTELEASGVSVAEIVRLVDDDQIESGLQFCELFENVRCSQGLQRDSRDQ